MNTTTDMQDHYACMQVVYVFDVCRTCPADSSPCLETCLRLLTMCFVSNSVLYKNVSLSKTAIKLKRIHLLTSLILGFKVMLKI